MFELLFWDLNNVFVEMKITILSSGQFDVGQFSASKQSSVAGVLDFDADFVCTLKNWNKNRNRVENLFGGFGTLLFLQNLKKQSLLCMNGMEKLWLIIISRDG